MSEHFGTSAEVSYRHFGTGAEVSWVRSVLGPKCPRSEVSVFVCIEVSWVLHNTSPDQRICKPPKAARIETNGPTGYEKRNLGQMCHSVVCRCTEPAGSTMPLLSLELSDTES